MITAIMPKPSRMDTIGDSGCDDELTVHRINRGINEIVEEYEEMVSSQKNNPLFLTRDTSFASQRGDCELIPKEELELLRATAWYCCSDISDELMIQMYRRRSNG